MGGKLYTLEVPGWVESNLSPTLASRNLIGSSIKLRFNESQEMCRKRTILSPFWVGSGHETTEGCPGKVPVVITHDI